MYRMTFSAFVGLVLCLSATSSFGQGLVVSDEEIRLLTVAEGALITVQKTNNSTDLQKSIDSIRSIGANLVAKAATALRQAESINARPETHLALMDLSRFGSALLVRAAYDLGDAASIDKNPSISAAIWEARDDVVNALIATGNAEAFVLLPGEKDRVNLNRGSTRIANLYDSTVIIGLLPISLLVLTALSVFVENSSRKAAGYGASKHKRSARDNIYEDHLRMMQRAANDLTVPDDVLLSMRAEARKFRRVCV